MPKVTDPALLAELNGSGPAAPRKVTDPALLAQLNGTPPQTPDTNETQMMGYGAKGAAEGVLSSPNDIVRLILSAGPNAVNGIAGLANMVGLRNDVHVHGPDWLDAVPDAGHGLTQALHMAGVPEAQNPTDKYAEYFGRILGGAAVPETALTLRAGGTLADIIKGMSPAVTSAIGGGVAGNVAPGNDTARAVGELIGGVVPSTAMSGLRAVTAPEAVTSTGAPVPRKLTDAVKRDNVPLDQVAPAVADISPAATVADLGDNTQKLAMGLATRPGDAGSTVSDALKQRAADSTTRVPAAVNDVLGPVTEPSAVKADIAANKKAVGPEYDVTQNTPSPIDPRPIASALDTAIDNSVGPAQAALRQIRESLNVRSTGELSADPDKLLQVRQAIDGIVGDTQNGNVKRVLGNVRDQIDGMLSQTFPDIKSTDARYQELGRQGDALAEGANVLDGGKGAVRPADNAQAVAEGVQPGGDLVGPSAATFRMTQGVRADIDRIVGTNINDRAKLAQIVQTPSDWNYQKLSQLFGEDRAAQLLKVVEGERRMAATEAMGTSGAKTAAAHSAQADLEGGPIAAGADIVRAGGWSPQNAVFHALGKGVDAFGSAVHRKRDQSIADLIMGRGDFTPVPKGPFYTPEQEQAMLAAIVSGMPNGR